MTRDLSALLLALVLTVPWHLASAQEATVDDAPPPREVADLLDPLGDAFRKRVRAKTLFPRLREALDHLPPFFRDTHVLLRPRSYYFNRHGADRDRVAAWAMGGALEYHSGWLADTLSLGAAGYTSQRLQGRRDEDGTRLLRPEQRSITVLGQANARLRHRGHTFTGYRQTFDLPWVNRQDNRMIPTTFEGYSLTGRFGDPGDGPVLDYVAGHLTHIKQRDSDEFIPMAQAAGVEASRAGLTMVGARLRLNERISIGAIDYFVDDVLNIGYAVLDVLHHLRPEVDLRGQIQFTHQSSLGDDRLAGQTFDTWALAGRFSTSYRSALLIFAAGTTDDAQRTRSPFGSYPGYISLMQSDFNRAGEDAWMVATAYTFDRLGCPGLSLYGVYAEGRGASEPRGSSLRDQREGNLTIDYRILDGLLRGLWLRVRGSMLDGPGSTTSNELRVILNYDIPVL